jgi:hypothetical protein
MKKHFRLLAMLGIVLVLGLVVTGCGDPDGGPTGTPTTPVGLKFTVESISSIKISWNYIADANSYILYRATDSASNFQIIKGEALETVYLDTGLSLSSTYYYKVAAKNSHGISNQSSTLTATTKLTLKSGMTVQEMLNCSAGSLSISSSQWAGLKSLASFSLYDSTGSSGSFSSAFINAYPTYLDVFVTTTSGSGITQIRTVSRYRHYR